MVRSRFLSRALRLGRWVAEEFEESPEEKRAMRAAIRREKAYARAGFRARKAERKDLERYVAKVRKKTKVEYASKTRYPQGSRFL